MTDRKRIYAIHIVEPQPSPGALYRDDIRDVHIYRKTRFQQTTHRRYRTDRGLALAFAMRQAGYPAQPFTEADWAVGELPYRLVYRETGVKFEIPGRFDNLDTFYHLRPSIYARIKGLERRVIELNGNVANDAERDTLLRQAAEIKRDLAEDGLYARRE